LIQIKSDSPAWAYTLYKGGEVIMDMSPLAEQCVGDQGVGHDLAINVAGGVERRSMIGNKAEREPRDETPRNQLFGELLEVSDQVLAVLLIFDAWEVFAHPLPANASHLSAH
jgi:hypothetical protein